MVLARCLYGTLAAVLAVGIVLGIETFQQNARLARVAAEGVPVVAHITGCLGLASGTGITAAGYTCQAAYLLNGEQHVAVLNGFTALHQPGDNVRAVAVAGKRGDLSLPASQRASWTSYLLPAALVLPQLLGLGYVGLRRWFR